MNAAAIFQNSGKMMCVCRKLYFWQQFNHNVSKITPHRQNSIALHFSWIRTLTCSKIAFVVVTVIIYVVRLALECPRISLKLLIVNLENFSQVCCLFVCLFAFQQNRNSEHPSFHYKSIFSIKYNHLIELLAYFYCGYFMLWIWFEFSYHLLDNNPSY